MPQPNFFIIGAQKSGSSWLARNLAKHPDVFIVRQEIHFFDKRKNFEKGRAWYEAHFAAATHERMVGEKTPDYLWVGDAGAEGHISDAHRRIHAFYPEARLIVVLRNPVDRAVSAVNHLIRTGRVSPLHSIDQLLIGDKQHLIRGHGVLEKGRYYKQILAYLELFKRDQLLILLFEDDIVKQPRQCLAQVCSYLGIDPTFPFDDLHEKVNQFDRSTLGLALSYYLPASNHLARRIDRYLPHNKKQPGSGTIARLYDLYAADNERLFAFLERWPAGWIRSQEAVS